MTTFKEISVEDYKKLLDNRQHTYAKTFKNVELLQNFEEKNYRNDINDIIDEEKEVEKENKYIEKLTDKLSEKINKNNGELLNIHNNDKESVLNFVKNVYIKYKNASLYKPRNDDIEEVSLESIMNSIKNNKEIGRSDREHIYNIYKTNNDLKDININYNINKIINNELIKQELLTEDDTPIISILTDINTFKIIVLIEDGYELHLDDNFSKMLGFSDKVLKKYLQRSDLIPQINSINYLKIYCNIIDNKNNPYYLSKVFIKSGISELTVYTESSIFKKTKNN